MNHFVLSGVNATIALDHAGITIKHSLTRREKAIAWTDVGSVHLEPGNWLTRPKLYVLTKKEARFLRSDFNILKREGASEAAQWFIVVPMGQDEQFAALKQEILRRAVVADAGESALQPGDGVLVAWSDGQRYPANVRAEQGAHVLVAFPNGSEQWVGREQIFRA